MHGHGRRGFWGLEQEGNENVGVDDDHGRRVKAGRFAWRDRWRA
jgi:hypothetical protein